MAHAPATLFRIKERGYLREGFYADIVLVKPEPGQEVSKKNLLYKCGWSPFEGHQFSHQIHSTYVNGNCVYADGQVLENGLGERLLFNPR